MLQELGKQNPQLVRLIQEHQADFLRLINEPAAEGGEGYNKFSIYAENIVAAVSLYNWVLNMCFFSRCSVDNILGQLAGSMPQAISVTPEEREAIERVRLFD